MSIRRWAARLGAFYEDEQEGKWVRYDDHVAEVERLTADLAAARSLTDGAYAERNQVVAAMAKMALALGWSAGTARTDIEGREPEWHGCVYIDLPTGQASWHYHDREAHLFADLPPYSKEWDTHTTRMKYDRLAALPTAPEQEGTE